MNRTILVNAFSLNMVKPEMLSRVRMVSTTYIGDDTFDVAGIKHKLNLQAVGHKETANLLTEKLGQPVGCTRSTLTLGEDDVLIVAQYRGPRLELGVTSLPEGATIEFVAVYFEPVYAVYTVGKNRTPHKPLVVSILCD